MNKIQPSIFTTKKMFSPTFREAICVLYDQRKNFEIAVVESSEDAIWHGIKVDSGNETQVIK